MAAFQHWHGFTLDSFVHVIRIIFLQPLLTLPLYLLVCFRTGSLPGITEYPSLLFAASIVYRINKFLNEGVENNWTSDEYDWTNELVVITGGSSGIGAEIVRGLSGRGIKVIILDIQQPATSDHLVYFYQCDLSSTSQIASLTASITTDHGHPTVIVNNAGVWNRAPLLQTTNEQTSRLFAINTLAQHQILKAFLPMIVRRNHGMIVTVSSVGGFGGSTPGMVDYAASKAAAVVLHEGLSAELVVRYHAPKVRTVLVVPNVVRTPMAEDMVYDNTAIPMLEPETVAERALKQILSGKSGLVIVPSSVSMLLTVRAWPRWLQKSLLIHPSIAGATVSAEQIAGNTWTG